MINDTKQETYKRMKPILDYLIEKRDFDFSGYPRNLRGKEIIIEARILAVADVVESMASHRPYRAALGIDVALKEIEKNRGTLYDNAVVDACLRLFREKGFQMQGIYNGNHPNNVLPKVAALVDCKIMIIKLALLCL